MEETMSERGLAVDQSTVFRWVQRYAPEIHKRKRPHLKLAGISYRIDETSFIATPLIRHRRFLSGCGGGSTSTTTRNANAASATTGSAGPTGATGTGNTSTGAAEGTGPKNANVMARAGDRSTPTAVPARTGTRPSSRSIHLESADTRGFK